MEKEQQNQKEEFQMEISGKLTYSIELKEKSYSAKYEVNNENNLIALMMVKEIITFLVERNSNPNIPKNQKLKGEKFAQLCKAAITVGDLGDEIAGHLIKKAIEGGYKPEIIMPKKPTIIMP